MAKKSIKKVEEKQAGELAKIRKAIEDIELLRYGASKEKRTVEVERLEYASLELKEKEREIIKSIGESIASKIKAEGESLGALSEKLKERVKRMGRLPKRLDKISKVILKISDIISL